MVGVQVVADGAARPAASAGVTLSDLRYARESDFYEKIAPLIDNCRESLKSVDNVQEAEADFFTYLSHAVRVDAVPRVAGMIDKVKVRLGTSFPINLFVHSATEGRAMCQPRYRYTANAAAADGHTKEIAEVIIVVSQHFFNDLSEDEQAFVIGHEVGHAALGHLHMPLPQLLHAAGDTKLVQELGTHAIHWSVCGEISADLLGYVASGGNARACTTSLLKMTTGFRSDILESLGVDDVIASALQQFEKLSSSVHQTALSTHPLTPLRLKLLHLIGESPVVRSILGASSNAPLQTMKDEHNRIIDVAVASVYPEFFDKGSELELILYHLGLATAFADGVFDESEVVAVQRIVGEDAKETRELVDKWADANLEGEALIEQSKKLVQHAVTESQQKNFTKKDAVRIIRQALAVAAADGSIDSSELHTLYAYGTEFGIDKHELVLLANQVFVH